MGHVITLDELRTVRDGLRKQRQAVVFTNGVFDIIHRGHVEYLTRARSLGDVLVVGMNSDTSVHRIKGEKRPIVAEADRAFVLSSLLPVDYVCLFNEDTPYELIKVLTPDVLVKGADWSVDAIVGKDIVEKAGGIVRTIDFVPERSTSSIIDTILARYR